MKTKTPEESAFILSSLCSERLDIDAIKYYLEASPTVRDFRNRFAAVFFRQYQQVLQCTARENGLSETTKLAEDFDTAREVLDTIKHEFDMYVNIIARWGDAVDGFGWKTQKHRVALSAIAVIESVRDLARAHGAIRFDPDQPIPRS